jgi:hypothetical protein
MSAIQFFPIPPELFALACETVSRRVSRLPFLRSDVMVTCELLGVAMECLNAEFKKKLALHTPSSSAIKTENGLDRCIEERLKISGKKVVPVIAGVLCSAGIAETTEITDRLSHQSRKGIRLLPPWTWHTASGKVPVLSSKESVKGDESSLASMMSMCPVCRTGILNRVVGKQLFGIPRTDFYMECTYCGAKFIPVGTQFRLVSVATFRDPLWKKHLDHTFPAETWSAMARGTSGVGKPIRVKAGKKTISPSGKSSDGSLTQLKDGSLAVPCGEKTLYFKPVRLNFIGGVREDFFARAQKPLQEILKNPAYSHLIPLVNVKYSNYVHMKSGLFLRQLKERHDPFYLEFLNNFGDEKYGTFRLDESDDGDKKGVLVIVVNRSIYYVVDCQESFRFTINNTFGRISPEDCFLGGDSIRCRINALISNNRNDAGICIHRCEKEEERVVITELLKGIISI